MLDLQAAREEREREVKRLTREVDEGGNERKELEVRLESAKMEVAATVQLSELALAAKGAAGTQRLEELVGQEVFLFALGCCYIHRNFDFLLSPCYWGSVSAPRRHGRSRVFSSSLPFSRV